MTALPRHARGFALMLALFLIVLLGVIAAYLITTSNVQVESGALDEQGARAYQAARAGLDWGAYQVLRNGTCPPGTTTLAFPADHLSGFRAEVSCTAFGAESEGGNVVNTYRIVSTGCNLGPCGGALGPGYVERQLHLTLAN
jgi:MSHA biogenesis protein MshP